MFKDTYKKNTYIVCGNRPWGKKIFDNYICEFSGRRVYFSNPDQLSIKILKKLKPNVIYTHSKSDVNIDHRRTLEALEPAMRPYANQRIMRMLSFEISSSTESNFVRERFAPNFFIGLNKKILNAKIKALECYDSEIRKFPNPRSSEYLKSLATIRSAQRRSVCGGI